ncbi:MAG: hypothetical protein AAGI22_06950 [Planctomycetota bacterium]
MQVVGQPVIGTALELNLTDLPTTSASLLSLGTRGSVVQGPGGINLLVDPATATYVPVPIDSDGNASYSLPIPNDPILVGLDLRAQYLTIDVNNAYGASDLILMTVGAIPGSTGFGDLNYNGESVEVDLGEYRVEATLQGQIEVDEVGTADGVCVVELSSGPVTVAFDGSRMTMFTGENVIELGARAGDDLSITLNGHPIPIEQSMAIFRDDIFSGSWSPLTEGILGGMAVASSEQFIDHVQTFWLYGGPSADIVCKAIISLVMNWYSIQVDQTCDAIAADCRRRRGKYGPFHIDCAVLETICDLGGLVTGVALQTFLTRYWGRTISG